jgi:hypothetical protein
MEKFFDMWTKERLEQEVGFPIKNIGVHKHCKYTPKKPFISFEYLVE